MPGPAPHLTSYFHVWADGSWQTPVSEWLAALASSGLDRALAERYVGIVGSGGNRRQVRAAMPGWNVVVEARVGWEQVTLSCLRDNVTRHQASKAVLYAHTKGAHDNSALNRRWRQRMTCEVVDKWRQCADLLADGYDAVGPYWLTPKDWPNTHVADNNTPMFGGNFWWARSEYLRRLPEVTCGSRFEAETWLGRGGPRVFNLRAGWPP